MLRFARFGRRGAGELGADEDIEDVDANSMLGRLCVARGCRELAHWGYMMVSDGSRLMARIENQP